MRTILFFLLLHFSLIVAAQQSLQVSPLFQRVIAHADDKVYDTKAWSVYTGSPVRATPLVLRNLIVWMPLSKRQSGN